MNLVLETVQTRASRPWPEKASQTETQSLKYDFSLFVISPYETLVQRTKVKCVSSSFAPVLSADAAFFH